MAYGDYPPRMDPGRIVRDLQQIMDKVGIKNAFLNYGRLPLYDPKIPMIFFWSEKSGCTSLVKWFFDKVGLLEEAAAHNRWVHNYENEVFKRQEGYLDRLIDAMADGVPSIKLVRDPGSRAFSGYLELTRHQLAVKKTAHWGFAARHKILKHIFGDHYHFDYPFSFVQYVDWLVQADPKEVNSHLAPQYTEAESFIPGGARLMRLENYDGEIAALEQELGLAAPKDEGEKLTDSGHHHEKHQLDGFNLDAFLNMGVPLQRGPRFLLPVVTTETLKACQGGVFDKVSQAYEIDYKTYGYG
ncbi:MAG: hypothetical protein ACPGO3_04730 [Magnetospiraceae bacterium]